MERLQGKHIVLGITGGIAAYKSAMLLRMLVKEGAEVQVVMTPAAKEFITPLTLSTLSKKPVVSEFFDRRDGSWNSHVELGLWADLMLIAPTTAHTLAQMAHGMANNMLLTTYLSMRAPVAVAPAMDMDMWKHPATQQNLKQLQQIGVTVIEPDSGFLASTLEGKGRMQEPQEIVNQVVKILTPQAQALQGKRVMITAGPTHEPIDRVRFLGNRSTGLMGIALAEECISQGAEVDLLLGPSSLQPIQHPALTVHRFSTAQELLDLASQSFPHCDVAIFAAAVADFRPAQVFDGKIKRERQGEVTTIQLVQNPDVAAQMGVQKQANQLLIGFALETSADIEEAKAKMQRKKMDAMVLNSLSDAGAGFAVPTNKITIVDTCQTLSFPLASKQEVAKQIVAYIVQNQPDERA